MDFVLSTQGLCCGNIYCCETVASFISGRKNYFFYQTNVLSLQVTRVYIWKFFVLFCTKTIFPLCYLEWEDEWTLHFNIDFIHFITAEAYIEILCFSSFSVYLLCVLCLTISVFLLFDGLRVLIEMTKVLKSINVLGKATKVMQW